ncbi:MAG: TlpA family protein disulfide reductase [Rhodobacteraceae bacterium]|nr:TlpA family protein disulfide reductase [Paracoccaceae bacterium]
MRIFAPIALLYAALTLGAIPVGAQEISAEFRAELMEMRADDMRKLKVLKTAGDAVEIAFTDPAGAEHFLSDTNGMIRVVNFWATWCAPCREEMPQLSEMQTLLGGDDFQVLAIATGRNRLEGIERFNTEAGVDNLPILLDPQGALAAQYGALGLPLTVILNRDGQEIARLTGGADWISDSALSIIQAIIRLDG